MAMATVFVYEHVVGGGFAGQVLPPSLSAEGLAMLSAVVRDLAALDDVHVVTSLDVRLARNHRLSACEVVAIERKSDDVFMRQAIRSDRTLLIAPETHGMLLRLTRLLKSLDVQTLGSSAEAVALCGDKVRTARYLESADVPTISTGLVQNARAKPLEWNPPWVIKPRFGAGCENTRRVDDAGDLPSILSDLEQDDVMDLTVVQPFHTGLATSVAFLVGPSQCLPLMPARQYVSTNGRFVYSGGELPLTESLAGRAIQLASKAVMSIAGLRGYVGVDLVLGQADDGSDDVVVEVNPRLTTSYVGLRAMTNHNLADIWWRISAGSTVRPPEWKRCCVTFGCDGSVRTL